MSRKERTAGPKFSATEDHAHLAQLGLVDAPQEEVFDRLTEYARSTLGAAAAMVSIVEPGRHRQYFKSVMTSGRFETALRETPLSKSFCKFVRAADAPFVVCDAEADPRVAGNPIIVELGLRAYLGCPIHLPDGRAVGALCVIDRRSRSWTRFEIEQLRRIASYDDGAISMTSAHKKFTRKGDNVLELRDECARNTRLASQIWTGLQRDEFVPYYQPQIDARTGWIHGVEVLMRWNRPERGIVSPSEFMAHAKDLELLSHIDAAVVTKALRDLSGLSRRGEPIQKVSFNVTSAALRNLDIVDSISAFDLPDTRIALEILESILIEDPETELDLNLDLLRERGFAIEIDDFGSGHASIVGLLRVRPDALKIDQRLVIPTTVSEAYRRIVGSVIDIARTLGAKVTAEGVETAEHAKVMTELGCDVLQGYHYARPMSFDDLTDFMAQA